MKLQGLFWQLACKMEHLYRLLDGIIMRPKRRLGLHRAANPLLFFFVKKVSYVPNRPFACIVKESLVETFRRGRL